MATVSYRVARAVVLAILTSWVPLTPPRTPFTLHRTALALPCPHSSFLLPVFCFIFLICPNPWTPPFLHAPSLVQIILAQYGNPRGFHPNLCFRSKMVDNMQIQRHVTPFCVLKRFENDFPCMGKVVETMLIYVSFLCSCPFVFFVVLVFPALYSPVHPFCSSRTRLTIFQLLFT